VSCSISAPKISAPPRNRNCGPLFTGRCWRCSKSISSGPQEMKPPDYSFKPAPKILGLHFSLAPPIPHPVNLCNPLVSLSSIFLPRCLRPPPPPNLATSPRPPRISVLRASCAVLRLDPSPCARRHRCARPRARSLAILLSVHVSTPDAIGARCPRPRRPQLLRRALVPATFLRPSQNQVFICTCREYLSVR
jgi:hypothetical protein